MVKNRDIPFGFGVKSFLHSEKRGFSDCYFCKQKQHDDDFIFAEKKSW